MSDRESLGAHKTPLDRGVKGFVSAPTTPLSLREQRLTDARDAWRDAFYYVTRVRDRGYLPPDIRAQAAAQAVDLAKSADERVDDE